MNDTGKAINECSEIPRTVIDIDPYMCDDSNYLNVTFSDIISSLRYYGFCQVSVITDLKVLGEMIDAIKEVIIAYRIISPWLIERGFDFEVRPMPLGIARLFNPQDTQLRGAIITALVRPPRKIIIP